MKPIYFMRHGQTAQNARGVIRSWGDAKLDKTGIEQAEHAGNLLKGKGIVCVYASDLARNKQTGEIVSKILKCELEIVKELRTWKLPYHGQKISEIKSDLNYYQQHPDKAPPGGESGSAFRKRAVAFFKDQIEEAGEGEINLIIGNGRHTWDLRNILRSAQSNEAFPDSMPVKLDGPGPGSVLKIELPSCAVKVIYLAPVSEDGSL